MKAWLEDVDGRKIDRDGGFPARDPYQCWDLWADYAERVYGVPLAATFTNYGGSTPHSGYACNVFHNAHRVPALMAVFDVVGADQPGRNGDVAFWEKGGLYAGSHVAIVIEDLSSVGRAVLRCMSQNKGPGHDAAAYETLSKSTLLGYLRPRTKHTAPVAPDTPATVKETPVVPFLTRIVRGTNVGSIDLWTDHGPSHVKPAELDAVRLMLTHLGASTTALEINSLQHQQLSSVFRNAGK